MPEKHIRRKRPRPDYYDDPNMPIPLVDLAHYRKPIFKRGEEDPNAKNCTVCLYYNSILYFDFITRGQMLVVEQPWLRVIETLPAPLQRRVYGAN